MANFIILIVLTVFVVANVKAVPQFQGNQNNQHHDRETLRFKVLGRSLKDKDTFGSIDPYVVITYTENEGTSETRLGKSGTISRSKNPDWSDIFTFNFDRYKRQRWHFIVKDHDVLARDDKAGEVWVSVSDYVDAGQYLQVNLIKKGYLIIKKA